MIFSKANLQIVELTKTDKAVPALDNVHFCPDGSTVATNGTAQLIVSPVARMREHVPLESSTMPTAETVPSETVREVLKNMPKDSTFNGVLEHCDLIGGKFTLTDGKRKRSIAGKLYPRDYVPYDAVLSRVGKTRTQVRVAVNLKRLLATLLTVEKIVGDSSGNAVLYLEFTEDDDVVIRARNASTEQQVLGVVSAYKYEMARWPELSEWEKKILGLAEVVANVKRKIAKEASDGIASLRRLNLTLKKAAAEKFGNGVASLRKSVHDKARSAL